MNRLRPLLRALACLAIPLLPGPAGAEETEAGTLGTGILGVVTGISSIHVNGLNIETPDGLMVGSRLGAQPASALRPGDTVIVTARRQNGVLTAREIERYHPVIAPLDDVGPDRLVAAGMTIDVSEARRPPSGSLEPGDWVAVSGLWRGDLVMASAIDEIAPRDLVTVSGSFSSTDEGRRVGALRFEVPVLQHAEPGDGLTVTGEWQPDAEVLIAREVQVGLFPREVETLLIEGYLSPPDRRGTYTIYGTGLVAYTGGRDMEMPQERSLFCVRRADDPRIVQELPLDLSSRERLDLLEAASAEHRQGAPSIMERCLRKR